MSQQKQKINWQSLIFSHTWLKDLDRLTTKRFGEGGLAEEASTYVLKRLSEDNWCALSAFKGQSKPETYLYTIKLRYIEEFSRKRFGRPRPPEWLKKQGEFWVMTWKLICLEKQITQTVIDRLSDIRDALYVKDVIRTIKVKLPWCGNSQKEIPAEIFEQENDHLIGGENLSNSNIPENVIAEARHSELLLMLNYLLNSFDMRVTGSTEPDPDITPTNVTNSYTEFSEKIEIFKQQLQLSTEEKLILKMAYQDGFKKTAIAKALGMKPHLPGKILKRVFRKIKLAMKNTGFTLDEITFESTLE